MFVSAKGPTLRFDLAVTSDMKAHLPVVLNVNPINEQGILYMKYFQFRKPPVSLHSSGNLTGLLGACAGDKFEAQHGVCDKDTVGVSIDDLRDHN